MAEAVTLPVIGAFTASAQASPSFKRASGFNISLSGTWVATVNLERSFDQGATWVIVKSYTANAQEVVDDPSPDNFYRFNCTAFTSGPVVFRIG